MKVMLLIVVIGALVMGAITGVCLHRFCQNGWIPYKYLQDDKAGITTGKREVKTSAPERSSSHRRTAHKAFAL